MQRLSGSWGNDSGEELVSNSDATDSEMDPEMEDEGGESGEEGMDTPLGGGVDVEGQLSSQRREGGEKLRKKSGLYQPPTHEELQTLKETQNLFKSNLMRLQVSDLPSNSLTFSLPPPSLPLSSLPSHLLPFPPSFLLHFPLSFFPSLPPSFRSQSY